MIGWLDSVDFFPVIEIELMTSLIKLKLAWNQMNQSPIMNQASFWCRQFQKIIAVQTLTAMILWEFTDYYNSTVIRAGIYLLSVIMTIGVWTAIITRRQTDWCCKINLISGIEWIQERFGALNWIHQSTTGNKLIW